jgi:hypothetical protein
MRNLMIAAATVAVLAASGPLASGSAEAMTLPGASNLGTTQSMTENVRLVCRTVWRFGRPHRVCNEVGPRFRDHRRYGPPMRPMPRHGGHRY